MQEIWKEVPESNGKLQVSNLGNTRKLIPQKQTFSNGYKHITVNGKSKYVHRLVAMVFIPEIAGKKYINHKNGIRDDNRAENLEWCTHQENVIHSFKVLNRKVRGNSRTTKPVLQYDLEGRYINRYASQMDATTTNNIHFASLSRTLNYKKKNKSHKCKGFYWYYESDDNNPYK